MLENCQIIPLPKITDGRGSLGFVEGRNHIPFNIERVFYLYDVRPGADRGAHAHKELHQFFIATSGSFDISLDDGFNKKNFHLTSPEVGLYVGPMIWCELNNFSAGSVCLALASQKYDENDYYRKYSDFIDARI